MAGPFGNFFGSRLTPPPPPLPQPKKNLGQGVGGLCCSAPDGSAGWCFDANYNASGRCGAVWGYDPAGGGTICVPDTSGDPWSVGWVHPACPSGAPAPPPEPPPEPPPPEPPPGMGKYFCCNPDGNLIVFTDVTQCPVGTTEVAEGVECPPPSPPPEPPPPEPPPTVPPPPPSPPPEPPPPEPPPSAEEEALACQTNGTFDLYDATGQLVASDVAEEDLPAGVEIVAVDDPRCGPAPEPGVVSPTGDVPSAIPTPGPTAASIPTTPLAPLPGVPQAPQAPAQGPFTSQIYPCGTKLPVSVRSLRTETLPSRPDSWKDQWTSLYR